MNKFKDAYTNSKQAVTAENQAKIDREHALVLESVKREFGITSFSTIDEVERNAYKSLVLEYWDPKSGLTEKGVKYVNEGASVVNADSSAETIKKHVSNAITPVLREWVDGTKTPAEVADIISNRLVAIRENGAKIKIGSVKDKDTVKGIMAEQLCKLFCAKVSSLKI